MPVGTVDYRERLRGPGTQDVLAMILRGLAMPGGQDNTPVDPATGKALQEALGIPSAPKREVRPDELAAEADRKAREAFGKMVAPQSLIGRADTTPWTQQAETVTKAPDPSIRVRMTELGGRDRPPVLLDPSKLPPSSGVSYRQRIAGYRGSANINIMRSAMTFLDDKGQVRR